MKTLIAIVQKHLPGLCVAAVAIALVGGRYAWLRASRPAHAGEIAATFGSVGVVYGTPQTTYTGDKITFVQTTLGGVGVFLYDTQTRHKQLIVEELEKDMAGEGMLDYSVWPWSPDDQLFIYRKHDIVICGAETGQEAGRLRIQEDNINALAWLAPGSFVCVGKSSGRPEHLYWVKNEGHQKWKQSQLTNVLVNSSCFTAISIDTIAWYADKCIWAMNLALTNPAVLFKPPTNQTLLAFNYSKQTGQFLLECNGKMGHSLWCLSSVNQPDQKLTQLKSDPTATIASWINANGRAYAYLSSKGTGAGGKKLVTSDNSLNDSGGMYAQGNVERYAATPDAGHLIIVGSFSNQPASGIWQYDVVTKSLSSIVPYTDAPSPYARQIIPLRYVLHLPDRNVAYYLYPPANMDRHSHKKCPLLIGDTLFQITDTEYQGRIGGPLWAQAIAGCGAYVVIVERYSWYIGLDKWEDNVMAVYQNLVQNSTNATVDANRVFLFGASAETRPLSSLVEKHPGLWRGALMLSPTQLPEFSTVTPDKPMPEILLSVGGREKHGEDHIEWLKRYQKTSLFSGLPVELVVHTNATHWLTSISDCRERTEAMVDFIFNN